MFRKIVFIICLFYSSVALSASMNSPQPRCVSVLPNGDISITWSTPADPGAVFNSYHIYTSLAASGPFVILDSIFTYTQTTYTHTGANGNNASRYYYIQTRFNNGTQTYSPPVDTVRSIYLNVSNPANGTALLSWNPISTPPIVSSTRTYKIYKEHPAGIWTLTGTTTNLTFIDSIMICNDTLNYRVEIADTTGCTSVSSVKGGKFKNIIPPNPSVLDTLSVDDNNHAQMNWNISPSPDVAGYIVYRFSGSGWFPVDTVFGINNTSYTYLLSIAHLISEQYRIAAYDSCGNLGLMGNILKTIYLTSVSDICNRSVKLNWTASPAIGTGLAGYRIYQSTVGPAGPFTLIGSVSSTASTFTASGLAPSINYYYKIQAFDASGTRTASSNRLTFYSSVPIPPTFSYLRKVSVVDPNRVDITCHVDILASTKKYKIMRSLDGLKYTLAGTVPVSATTPIIFKDYKVLTDKNSYYYKVINVDSCGYDGLETNVARTILLKVISNSDNITNSLIWNDYEGWPGGVLSYNIYRGIDGVMNPTPIANVLPSGTGTNFYVDDVMGILQGEGVFNYYVEAFEGPGNPYGFSETSLSNIAEAYQDPSIYIPNAFTPGKDFNIIFIPVTTYIDIKEYEFSIFNRWGERLFVSNDVLKGWDGTYKGKLCEFGVYVYLLRIKNSKDEYLERKGAVTLLR